MGRLPIIAVVLGTILVGGVSAAQQGLVVEPWQSSAPAQPTLRAPAATLPEPGLGSSTVPPVEPAKVEPAPPQPARAKWSPPVVALLVDPWAKQRLARPPRSRWVPTNVEIVDPWPEPVPESPRVASLPGRSGASPIF